VARIPPNLRGPLFRQKRKLTAEGGNSEKRQIQTCALLDSIEESASGQRIEPCDRVAPTVGVCHPKKVVPKSLSYLAKTRAVALEVNVMACASQAGPGITLVGDRAAHHRRQSVWHLYPSLRADPVASHRAYRSRSNRRARDDRPRATDCAQRISRQRSRCRLAQAADLSLADALAVVHGPPWRGAGQVRTVRSAGR
jgi:hypothetical protein